MLNSGRLHFGGGSEEYLRARLIEEADQPTLEEILDRAGGRSGGSVPLKTAVTVIRAGRARR
jgi:antitoxin FitA